MNVSSTAALSLRPSGFLLRSVQLGDASNTPVCQARLDISKAANPSAAASGLRLDAALFYSGTNPNSRSEHRVVALPTRQEAINRLRGSRTNRCPRADVDTGFRNLFLRPALPRVCLTPSAS